MTATVPPGSGFWDTLSARTGAAFLAHYDKMLTALMAAATGWGMVYMTAWFGALPQAPAPKPPAVEAARLPALDTQLAGRLDSLDAALKALRADIAGARAEAAAARAKRSPPPPPAK